MVNAVITVGRMPAAKSVCAESLTIAPNVNLNFYRKSQNSRKSDLILAIFSFAGVCLLYLLVYVNYTRKLSVDIF